VLDLTALNGLRVQYWLEPSLTMVDCVDSAALRVGGKTLEVSLRKNIEGLFIKLYLVEPGAKVIVPAPSLAAFYAACEEACLYLKTTPASTVGFDCTVPAGNKRCTVSCGSSARGRFFKISQARCTAFVFDADGADGLVASNVAALTAELLRMSRNPAVASELELVGGAIAAPARGTGSEPAPPAESAFASLTGLSREIHCDGMSFFFDMTRSAGSGLHVLRISELDKATGLKTSVVLPAHAVPAAHAVLAEFVFAMQRCLPDAVAAQIQAQALSAVAGARSHVGYGIFGVRFGDGSAGERSRAPLPQGVGAGGSAISSSSGPYVTFGMSTAAPVEGLQSLPRKARRHRRGGARKGKPKADSVTPDAEPAGGAESVEHEESPHGSAAADSVSGIQDAFAAPMPDA
jgi:hypothetical protein